MSDKISTLERLLTPVLERNYGGFDYGGWGTQPHDLDMVVVALKEVSNMWDFTPNFVKQLTKVSTHIVHRTNNGSDRDLFWKVVILHQQAEKYFAFERNIAFGIRGANHFSRLRSHILGHLGTLYETAFENSGNHTNLEKKFVAYEEASEDAKQSEPRHAKETFRIAGVTAKRMYGHSGDVHWMEKAFGCFISAKESSFSGSKYASDMAEDAAFVASTLYIETGESHWAEKSFELFQEVRDYDLSHSISCLPVSSYYLAEAAHTLLDNEQNPERKETLLHTVLDAYQTFLSSKKQKDYDVEERMATGFLKRFAN